MTSFVDLDVGRPGWLLGLVPGSSGAAVTAWLAAQPELWREGVEVVAVDPAAPFALAVRRLLPTATIVVDHWHLVRLANRWSPRCGSGSPGNSSTGAAARPTRRGRISGCSPSTT